jgi:hypothetical protein
MSVTESEGGDESIKFREFPRDFGSDRAICDLAHEAPDAVSRFGGVLFGSGVMGLMARALGYQGRTCVRRTNLQCSLEKVDERPLRPGA